MTSLANTVQEVFNEPACAKNQAKSEKERKKGCTKQLAPGAAAGGCAFDGAKIALQPITDVAHLVHGPIACEGNSWDNRGAKSSGSQIYRTGFTTDINETDVIFGGEKRLFKSIKEIIDKYDPPAVFVYQTCVPAMIGDDIGAVCKAAPAKFGKPVIPINLARLRRAEESRQQACRRGHPRSRHRHRGAGIHHALRHQHHRRIQSCRRAVAGQAAARRTRHPHPRLHIRRRQIPRSRLVAPGARGDDGVLQGDDQCRAQDGGALRNSLLRGLVLRHRRHQRLAARNRAAAGRSAARRTSCIGAHRSA